ncbi:MAG: hypothetical protein ACRDOV_03885, partial [Streptomyces sp.]
MRRTGTVRAAAAALLMLAATAACSGGGGSDDARPPGRDRVKDEDRASIRVDHPVALADKGIRVRVGGLGAED